MLMGSGALSCLVMGTSALYAGGRLPWLRMPVRGWADLYKTVYYVMVLGGAFYLIKALASTPLAVKEALLDFAAGVAGYSFILAAVLLLIFAGKLSPWLSLTPGAALALYGWRLRKNRPLWDH